MALALKRSHRRGQDASAYKPGENSMKITNLGELISETYLGFLEVYADPELASVATAAFINDLLSQSVRDTAGSVAA